MLRQLIVLVAVLAVTALAAPVENLDIPEEFKALFPPAAIEQMKTITPEQKALLTEVYKQHKDFKTDDEFLAALREKSPPLLEKILAIRTMVNPIQEKIKSA